LVVFENEEEAAVVGPAAAVDDEEEEEELEEELVVVFELEETPFDDGFDVVVAGLNKGTLSEANILRYICCDSSNAILLRVGPGGQVAYTRRMSSLRRLNMCK
jgi:hypothetical protein